MEKNKVVLLVSGGLDSTIAYKYLLHFDKEVLPLFINYKGRYTNKEWAACRYLYGKELHVDDSLNFEKFEIGEKGFIKNRNAHFALIASNYGEKICMAGLKDDNVGDKSPEAFIKMENLLNTINPEMNGTYSVFSPFWNKEKADIIEYFS